MSDYVFNLVIKLLMAFWDIQAMFSNFLFLQVDIRDKDGLEKVFASTR
jgi:UDP-glucose 4-epimerase